MKHYLKRVLLGMCMVVCLFSLSACASSSADTGETMDAAVADALKPQTISYLESLETLTPEEAPTVIKQQRENGQEAVAAGLESYMNAKKELGAYVSAEECTVRFEDGVYYLSTDATFEQRHAEFTLGVDVENNYQITTMSISPVYTVGENMEKAGMNTLMGMGTVFMVLIFISLLISLFKYIGVLENKLKEKNAPAAPAVVAPAPAPAAEENLTDDLELVAVITAAIAASEGTSADGLVVRSIRRTSANKWKRA